MKLLQITKVAIKNITSNKLRSILTMIGLIIGISSVIVLVGISRGSSKAVTSQVQQLGTDILTISIYSSDYSLPYDKLNELAEIENIDEVVPYKTISKTVSRGTTTSSGSQIIATNDKYLNVRNLNLAEGRTISIIDIENQSKVCIIGSDVATELFSLTDPLGQTLKIDGDNYTVIGVLEEQGTSMGTNTDSMLLIPLTTAKYLDTDTSITSLYAKVSDENKIDDTINLIENCLRTILQVSTDYFSVSSQDSMLSAMSDINNTLSLLMGGIASISLIVGGIGVMNVMLVSVTERTKEIGIRKSLGAKKKDILIQFLVEALVLSILGGVIGIGLGLLIGNIAENFGFTFISSDTTILISFLCSAAIGLVFGIFPAYRAACLNPIDALRQE
jgi:hypothetical protein